MAQKWSGDDAVLCFHCRLVIPPTYVARTQLKVETGGGVFKPKSCPWCREREHRGLPRVGIEEARAYRIEREDLRDTEEREEWERTFGGRQ